MAALRSCAPPARLQLGRLVLSALFAEPHHEVFRPQRHLFELRRLLLLPFSRRPFFVEGSGLVTP